MSGVAPDCLHCVIAALVEDWLRRDRIDPPEAVYRVSEVLGGLVGSFPLADQADLMTDLQEIIARFAREQVAAIALAQSEAAGRA